MLTTQVNLSDFNKKMSNIIQYSNGFIDGAKKGKAKFLDNLAQQTEQVLNEYIDSMARLNEDSLHHVYEWYRTGSPEARLFEFTYRVSSRGITFDSNFKQSTTVRNGSKEPFYDKARIMEFGIPVTIAPRKNVLVFQDGGSTVFTKNPVVVQNPGGDEVAGSFRKVVNSFFETYFTQSFLKSSGIIDQLKVPLEFKRSLRKGVARGRSAGLAAGYKWITSATAGVDI